MCAVAVVVVVVAIGVDEGPCTHTMRSTTTPPPSITINNILKFQADDEKVARNRQKQEDAIRSLKEETDALMDSLRANNAQRQRLMTERCSWLRNLVQVFYAEAVQAHDLVHDNSPQHELIDVGAACVY